MHSSRPEERFTGRHYIERGNYCIVCSDNTTIGQDDTTLYTTVRNTLYYCKTCTDRPHDVCFERYHERVHYTN